MPRYPAHGKYQFSWLGDVLYLEFFGAWNIEAFAAFKRDLKRFVEKSSPPRWGRIADLRQWEGATPEATLAYAEFTAWYKTTGAVAHAQIYPSTLMQSVADKINQSIALIGPVRQCASLDEALIWMKEFELETEEKK